VASYFLDEGQVHSCRTISIAFSNRFIKLDLVCPIASEQRHQQRATQAINHGLGVTPRTSLRGSRLILASSKNASLREQSVQIVGQFLRSRALRQRRRCLPDEATCYSSRAARERQRHSRTPVGT
jgi:hypothetical protein